jgi:hypothetical protein
MEEFPYTSCRAVKKLFPSIYLCRTAFFSRYATEKDHLCGLVVRVPGC